MKDSVILQVDESTKGLMEEIQSGISFSIEEGMKEVKDKVESVDGTTDMILRKFKNFEGLSSTVEQLRSLAEESKKFAAIVSPLENSVSELKQENKTQEQTLSIVTSNIDLLVKGVSELSDKENTISADINNKIQDVLNGVEKGNESTSTLLNGVLNQLSQAENVRQEISSKIDKSLLCIKELIGELSKHIDEKSAKIESNINEIAESHADFSKKNAENESIHQEFESKTSAQINDINKSIEKVQATLDIIVNMVTPFWKKW
ncbi:MAG: hypothetical protein KBT27_02575 [Prevotellaceae bacterium]|nr:hypothetical protein [Candidatus Faecinaster equi]